MLPILRPHDPSWKSIAEREGMRLQLALEDCVVRVEHIGSTAIEGIKSKPTIDLMPIVRSLIAFDSQRAVVESLGYEWRGEYGIRERRYCILNNPETGQRTFNVHCYEPEAPEVEAHIAFREYLRRFGAEARAYEAEKERAWNLHSNSSIAYQTAKADWITACQVRAIRWWRTRLPAPCHFFE